MDIEIIERYSKKDGRTYGIYFKDLDTDQTFALEARYELGGRNYFSGGDEPRGHYLALTPMKRGGGMVSFTAFSGIKVPMEERNRFSRKALQEFADRELDFDNQRVLNLYWNVREKNHLHSVEKT